MGDSILHSVGVDLKHYERIPWARTLATLFVFVVVIIRSQGVSG